MTVRHAAFHAEQPGRAALQFARSFPGMRIEVDRLHPAFAFDYRSLEARSFSVHRATTTGRFRASGVLPDSVSVGRRLAGTVSLRRGAVPISTSEPYLRPTASSELVVQRGGVMLITLRPGGLEDYLERSGDRAPRLHSAGARPQLAGWRLVMDHAARLLDRPRLLDDEAAEDELHDLLCWSLLQAFPDPWAETARTAARSSALRRALRHLEDHAGGTVTMPAVAESARVSVRTLGMLFERELGTTPHRWLTDHRVDRARDDLLAGRGTVAAIARRHGMRHAGRFAALYRARYGESPADTLRAAPRR